MRRNMEEYQRVQTENPEVVAGAGTAAVLLFLHIALSGYLSYAMIHLLRGSGGGVDWQSRLSWQYFFPACLALLTYFPSDGLTRVVARVAVTAGAGALAIALWVCVRGGGPFLQMLMALFSGAGPAVFLAEVFRSGLAKAKGGGRRPLWHLDKMPASSLFLIDGAVAFTWLIILFKTGATTAAAVFGCVLILFRIAGDLRFSGPRADYAPRY